MLRRDGRFVLSVFVIVFVIFFDFSDRKLRSILSADIQAASDAGVVRMGFLMLARRQLPTGDARIDHASARGETVEFDGADDARG